jgi:8-oxo-dGTP pyrophosphatase MutT (NUDIX family)
MSRIGPWERRSRTVAYENPWIVVYHDEVIRPDGAAGVYGVVHPRTFAAGIVAIDDMGRVALVGQHRYTLDEYTWEIPQGGVAELEDRLEGAKRELEEEVGVTAGTWLRLLDLQLQNSLTDERGSVYLATELSPGHAAPEGTEDITVRWVAFDEAIAMIDRGEITDSVTLIGLQKVARDRARQ